MKLKETGVLTKADLVNMGRYPSEERMKKGPVAVAECVQDIPCNPCETACPFKAIHIGENISNLPNIDVEKCNGCTTCVSACSGLAIFVLDKSYSDSVGKVSFPYEYNHSFKVNDIVKAADRGGRHVCDGKILKIANTQKADKTTVITLEVPVACVDEVRSIYRDRQQQLSKKEGLSEKLGDDVMVCRCEEITAGEIREAIRQGATDITGVKLRTRAGMGLCQGRTCEALVNQIIRQELGNSPEEIGFSTPRTPQRPVTFGTLGGGIDE
ncbi:(2Fe-2S)-binding protein [Anaerotignum propionicum]|uniref:(2Fe-2S)-binding protein n=1 Tax=Anaerotignum propionicum TaxID=28446 RepID=UPI00289AED82|nr:(2Fe-2S)-binding protein [Anaerotignum propionicum]MEA4841937.1 (2Fe-2S)-binding protein [[Clostridium] symbiosum]